HGSERFGNREAARFAGFTGIAAPHLLFAAALVLQSPRLTRSDGFRQREIPDRLAEHDPFSSAVLDRSQSLLMLERESARHIVNARVIAHGFEDRNSFGTGGRAMRARIAESKLLIYRPLT